MSRLMLTLPLAAIFLLVGVADYVAAQCDFFDEFERCITLPTNMVCGDPGVTAQQMQQINANRETVNAIENIAGPIYEDSPEAQSLGLTVTSPVVDLSFAQNNFFRRCEDQTLLTPNDNLDGGDSNDFPGLRRRRKRQTVDSSCCNASPVLTRIIASVTSGGNAVQVVQPQGFQQLFQDVRFCPSSINCAGILCGPIQTTIPAEVILLRPSPAFGRQNILIDICGAVSSP